MHASNASRRITMAGAALAVLAMLCSLAVLTVAPAQASGARVIADQFRAGETYTGTFADPTVMVMGNKYVAAATTTANLNLPMMTSRDLTRWKPRRALPDYRVYSDWAGYNDAMPVKSSWAATSGRRDRVALMSQWAPSLAKVGDRYLAAYSAAVRLDPRHSCIGIASSDSPLGTYEDNRAEPLVCFPKAPLGAIDPELFVDPETSKVYLLWKQEGIPAVQKPMLMSRRLKATGMSFRKRAEPKVLMTRDQGWEGSVVENPSMIRYADRYYLFYSGNAWMTGDYATGYAVCEGPSGPCRKPAEEPLLASTGRVAGPGGADAFVDHAGQLRLAYAAWSEGKVGPATGTRRLRVATLGATDSGRLTVTDHR